MACPGSSSSVSQQTISNQQTWPAPFPASAETVCIWWTGLHLCVCVCFLFSDHSLSVAFSLQLNHFAVSTPEIETCPVPAFRRAGVKTHKNLPTGRYLYPVFFFGQNIQQQGTVRGEVCKQSTSAGGKLQLRPAIYSVAAGYEAAGDRAGESKI